MENKNLIDNAVEFIQKNPKENLSLQSIADNAGFSLTYFDAIFKQHTGYTPVEYSRIYKLTRSALELRRTQRSVLDIALDFGYASSESFTRAFKNFYSITPSAYREKYSSEAVTWRSLSGRIAISRFRRNFPELTETDIDSALDFCFTHNPLKFAEDIVGMTVAETEILTLGAPDKLEHFVYISDYDSVEPSVSLVCEDEKDAIMYLKLLAKQKAPTFSIRKAVGVEWAQFDAEIAKLGLICRKGHDMIYAGDAIEVPKYDDITARLLTADDVKATEAFRINGGCAETHVKAIQIFFEGKGNVGMNPMGVFKGGELVCLALPTLDEIRELKKYDIGAIFALDTEIKARAVDLMWRYAIDCCINDGAGIGNAYANEDDSPLGVAACERVGLTKIAENRIYQK